MKSRFLLELLHLLANAEDLVEKSRFSQKFFTRNRKMSFQEILHFFFDLRRTSLQSRLNHFFDKWKGENPMSQQAFSKARNHFSHYPFEFMHGQVVASEYTDGFELKTWNGLFVFAVDGSYLQLPNTAEMRKTFGIRGFRDRASAGISVLFDVLSGWAVHPIIERTDRNERVACEKHFSFLTEKLPHIAQKSVVLLDRGYPSLRLIEQAENVGLRYLMRCPSQFVTAVNNAEIGSSTVQLGEGLETRVIKFALPSGEIETLITNLFDVAQAEIVKLYHMRWSIETAYGRLKNTLAVENFSGRTPNSVLQDFWASMLLMNCVAVFQREADEEIQNAHESKENKHIYRAKTSDLVVTLRDKFIFSILRPDRDPDSFETDELIKRIVRSVSPVRPGRSFPRNHHPVIPCNLQLKSHL